MTKSLLTLRKNPSTPITDQEAYEALKRITIELMEHGSVVLHSGTEESAAIIRGTFFLDVQREKV